ncbi:hypothetical protein GCM10025771_17050 [Niveibacterium umoris]|uniref:SPOR domain-containing protein n=1 Tax=Niveibacterium umoris TaxID=1193620 RepID=A0A840BUF6_9RHOO|nr:SPOR domain-containing protein [Niveibacterium umoris]MBB4014426.1 hypothetical protein [Niveibacterium umoris]
MKFLRASFFVLFAANCVLALLNLTGFATAPGGEPERLSSQLHPETLKVVGNGEEAPAPEKTAEAPVAAVSEPAPAAAASEPVAATESAPTESAVKKPLPLACVSWAGLSKAQSDAVALRAKDAGFVSKEQSVSGTASWWVHLPPQADRAAAEKKAEELKALGVAEFFIVKDGGANQNAISLGLYKSEESANRALEALKTKGVRSARVETRENTSIKLEVTGPADQLAGFSSETSSRLPNAPRANCTPAR